MKTIFNQQKILTEVMAHEEKCRVKTSQINTILGVLLKSILEQLKIVITVRKKTFLNWSYCTTLR